MARTVLNGRYELIDEVGKGGMAVTYRARDTLLNRVVAVKVMREQFSSDPDFVERFRREAQAAANLTHENIAGIYDTGEDAGRHYIVMEFVEGENLEQRLRRRGVLDPATVLSVALQVAAALDTAHRRGIVHRDIKPHNILITPDGRVKVTDFGIAKALTASSDTETGIIIGSVHYFSPEQARGDPTGPQSDLYSLGVVMFEAVTGHRPFEGENPVAVAHKQIYDQPPLPSDYRADLPDDVESIILRLLEKSLARRYESAAELEQDLEGARERLMGPGRPSRAARRGRGAAAWVLAVLAVALLCAGAYLYIVWQREARKISVPKLVGLDPASAERLVVESGLKYRAEPDGVYADVEAGLIARQNPEAQARVERDASVTVWLSLGTKYATVPDVARMSRAQAARRLEQAGLRVGQTLEQYDDRVPIGYVVASEPAAGAQAGKMKPVALILSKGPPPVTSPAGGPAQRVGEATIAYAVPDDVGSDQVQVRVEVVDDTGKRVLYDAPHMAGDQLPELKVRYTGRAIARVFIDGVERWSQIFVAESSAGATPGAGSGEKPESEGGQTPGAAGGKAGSPGAVSKPPAGGESGPHP
jgi:predicted Ser/Thr protein kinase